MFTYDEKDKILFSSDLFGSYKKEWDLYADQSHTPYIRNFIDHYVESKDAVMYAYNRIRELEIKMILPQHGGIVKEELVNDFIEILPTTNPGALIRELNAKPDKDNISKILQEGIQWFKIWLNKIIKPESMNELLESAQEEGPAALAMLFDVIAIKSKELNVTNPLSYGRVISWDTVKKSKSSQLVESIRNRYLKSQYSMNYGDEQNIDQLLLRRLSAVKKECAIMFIDIRGFSKWSIDKNADEIMSFLNKEHELVSKIINTGGGRVNKILGDGLLAYFLPEKIDACIQVAYNIHISIKKSNLLLVGIGLDFGEVILGDIGQESRLDYSLIGSVVNQASRYCSVAQGNQIGISENFFNNLAQENQKQIKASRNFKSIEVHVKAGDPTSTGYLFQVE
jgi:class 3 adenylate cyclase